MSTHLDASGPAVRPSDPASVFPPSASEGALVYHGGGILQMHCSAVRTSDRRMLFDLLFPVFLVAMVGGGVAFILSPDTFAGPANPTLELLKDTLPDEVALRIIQGFGGIVVLSALYFFYLLYLY